MPVYLAAAIEQIDYKITAAGLKKKLHRPALSVQLKACSGWYVCVRQEITVAVCFPQSLLTLGIAGLIAQGSAALISSWRSCYDRHVVSWRSPGRGDGRRHKLLPSHCQRSEHPAGGVRGVGTAGRVSVTSRHCCGFQSKLSEARRRRGIVGCRSPCFSSHSFLTHVFHFQPGLPTLFL